jgi:general transcription factor 3C polypeptide 3 (transcription factor C subunit 4)
MPPVQKIPLTDKNTTKEMHAGGGDPIVYLSLSAAFTQMLTHSKLQDRHHCLAKAVAFMQEYARTRRAQVHQSKEAAAATGAENESESWRLEQEIKYNTGRSFHQAGLMHFAYPYYEEVLQLYDKHHTAAASHGAAACSSGAEGAHPAGLEKEAAYNLALIYWNSGSKELSQEILKKYLSM